VDVVSKGLRGTMAGAATDAHVVLARITGAGITVVLEGNIAMDPKPYEKDGHRITINAQRWSVDQTSGFVWNLPHGYHPHDTCTFEVTAPDGGTATLTIWGSGEMSCYPPVDWIELPEGGVSFFSDQPNEKRKGRTGEA
jgi:hypothetical protein